MYLVEDKAEVGTTNGHCGGRWRNFPNSRISHHGAPCCDVAYEWLLAFDFAQLNGGDRLTGPRWMREHSAWGPSAGPIHWCEAVDAKIVDCGAHAAMAHEAFTSRGVPAYRAQFIQRYSVDAAASWRANWDEMGVSNHWIDGEAIYHEGNAVLIGADEVRLWDGSAGWWIDPRGSRGYGGLVALRIEAEPGQFATPLNWGGRRIVPNEWTAV